MLATSQSENDYPCGPRIRVRGNSSIRTNSTTNFRQNILFVEVPSERSLIVCERTNLKRLLHFRLHHMKLAQYNWYLSIQMGETSGRYTR